MKRINLRILALPMMAMLLLGSAPLQAVALQDAAGYGRIKDDKDKDKDKDKDERKRDERQVPEGSTGAIVVLAAGILGGGLLVWRRKKRQAVA